MDTLFEKLITNFLGNVFPPDRKRLRTGLAIRPVSLESLLEGTDLQMLDAGHWSLDAGGALRYRIATLEEHVV